ncbi:MAG: hypothetical protein PGN24_09685 [Microbacterium arborescens]
MSPRPTVAAACIALLTLGLVTTGCAERSGPIEIPTRSDDPGSLPRPTMADAVAWADGVIPDNAVGGTGWTQRQAGVLEPGREPLITVTSDEAPALVSIACISGAGGPMAYVVTVDGAQIDHGDVPCAAVDGTAAPQTLRDVPAEATIAFTAPGTGLFVYAVGRDRDPSR